MPKVYLYNPHTGISTELKSLPTISDVESRELSLLEANSDILWGDYAALRNLILFLDKWNSYGSFKKSLWRLRSKISSLIAKMIWKEKPIIDFDWMSKEHAYQLDFLTNRVFSCPNCIKTGHNIDSFKDENFIRKFIHIGDKDNPIPGYFTLDIKQFLDAIEKGYVECPSCHKRIQIKRNPSQDFYLWKKWTARTNSENNDWYIEKVPAYSVIDA
jgi:DNA-directed RNA polymerase subunit RPC12/RpoP